MKSLITTTALAAVASMAFGAAASAAPVEYKLDPSHSQIVFSYEHMGFSTTSGMFSGVNGTIEFDADKPADSSVSVSFPVDLLFTGWDARTKHFLSDDFFGADKNKDITFKSTGIEVTGEDTGKITGTLTMNGISKDVVLDAKLNHAGMHPMENKEWAGFDATTTVKRTDFDMGMYVPYVSDEVKINISIEAAKAE